MEIPVILGMLGAFALGAYVRKPVLPAKNEPPAAAQEIVSHELKQWENLLGYTGKPQKETEE